MKKIILSALVTTSMTMIAASADAAITGGTTAQPSAIRDRFEKKPEAKITNEVLIKDEAEQPDVAGAEKIEFNLNSVVIEGNTVLDQAELEALYKDKLGKKVNLADIYEIRDLITKKYREEGYVLSRAILPPQKINSGNVKIQVIEGRINKIILDGDFAGDKELLEEYVNKIRTDGPLNSNNLERYLLLMNDLNGTSANGTLRPSTSEPGAADLIITTSHDDVSGIVTFDNSGTKFVGEYLASAEVGVNSALGLHERISVRTIIDPKIDELKFGDITYLQPIGNEGTELRLNAGKARTKPGSSLSALNIVGDTDVYEAEVTHPFLRSRRENLTGHSKFAFNDTKSDVSGILNYEDKTRVVSVGATYDLADNYGGVNLFDLTAYQGIGAFGASDDSDPTSRSNGSATFTKFTMEASREQELTDTITLLLATEGQYSTSALLVGEEFSLGGDFGRGYDYSELTGDHGIAVKAELQFGFEGGYDYLQDYQLYTFYDFGSVWERNRIAGEEARSSLSSIGAGVRLNVVDNVSGYVQLSKPLTLDVASEGDRDPRLHFGLNYLF